MNNRVWKAEEQKVTGKAWALGQVDCQGWFGQVGESTCCVRNCSWIIEKSPLDAQILERKEWSQSLKSVHVADLIIMLPDCLISR